MSSSVVSRICAAAAGLVVAFGALANTAFADATPVQLVLLYMPGVSNTGNSAASGIAELVMPEGEVRVTAASLARLEAPSLYVAWAVNTDTNQFERLGAFNAAEGTGAVHYENVLPDAIPNKQWNLLLLTVEDSGDAIRPGNAHSIAGVFPSADNKPLPGLLPNTGGATDDTLAATQPLAGRGSDWLLEAGLAALALSIGAGAGYGVGMRRSASSHASRTDR